MTFKISEDIKIELYGSTSFIIGESVLGGPALLGDLTPTWHPLTCGVVSVDIDRGFSVTQGVLPSLEVGTANIVLSGFDVDPTLNPLFTLDAEIRVLVREPGETTYSPIFTGFVDDIQTSYAADGYITTTLSCTDWIPKIMNIVVPAGKYVAPKETFALRANRIIDDFILPRYPDIEISPAWFPDYGGSIFPQEGALDGNGDPEPDTGDRGDTTVGELLNELIQGEAGMIVVSRTGVVFGFGRYYYDLLMDNLDLTTVGDDFGFSNQHSTYLDHYCMGDIETSAGKSDIANEVIVRISPNVPFAFADETVVVKNQVSVNAIGSVALEADIYVAEGPEGDENLYLRNWAEDLSLPDSAKTRVRTLTWSPIRRDGLLNSSWDWDPGYAVTRVRIEYPSHTIDDKYVVSRLTHSITPENWVMSAELWKGI